MSSEKLALDTFKYPTYASPSFLNLKDLAARTRGLLLLLPLALCFTQWAICVQMFPLFSGPLEYDVDPAYQYLFNSVFLLNGHVPIHIDHPGTPLQVLGSLVIFLVWIVLSLLKITEGSIALSVATSPELYLGMISSALVLLNSWGLYYLGTKTYRSTASISLALLSQCILFTTSILIFRVGYPSPESLVIFVTLCLLGLLTPLVFSSELQPHQPQDQASPIWAGILCGFGIALKINFLPVLGLLLLFKLKPFLISLAFVIIGCSVGILPIISKVPDLLSWLINVVTHTGVHGTGNQGIFVFANFDWHYAQLKKAFPIFFAITSLFIIVLLAHSLHLTLGGIFRFLFSNSPHPIHIRNETIREWEKSKVLIAFTLVCISQTLFVLKHPGLHYMVPALPVAFFGFIWLTYRLAGLCLKKPFRSHAILILLGLTIAYCVKITDESWGQIYAARSEQDAALTQVQEKIAQFKNPIIVTAYRSTLPHHAVAAGLSPPWGPDLGPALNPLFSSSYMWDGNVKKLIRYGEPLMSLEVIIQALQAGRPVLLSTPTLYPDLEPFVLEPIFNSQLQQLFRITNIK